MTSSMTSSSPPQPLPFRLTLGVTNSKWTVGDWSEEWSCISSCWKAWELSFVLYEKVFLMTILRRSNASVQSSGTTIGSIAVVCLLLKGARSADAAAAAAGPASLDVGTCPAFERRSNRQVAIRLRSWNLPHCRWFSDAYDTRQRQSDLSPHEYSNRSCTMNASDVSCYHSLQLTSEKIEIWTYKDINNLMHLMFSAKNIRADNFSEIEAVDNRRRCNVVECCFFFFWLHSLSTAAC